MVPNEKAGSILHDKGLIFLIRLLGGFLNASCKNLEKTGKRCFKSLEKTGNWQKNLEKPGIRGLLSGGHHASGKFNIMSKHSFG